nr:hypothetical protein [uncultured Campylobacter sp.]
MKFYRWNFKISKNFIDETSLRRKILKRVKFQSLQNFEVCEIHKSRSNF